MRSSSRRSLALALAASLAACAFGAEARAQQAVGGFAVERFYPSPAGGGWLVMDDLRMHGDLGGTFALTAGYAHDPLRVATSDGAQRLAVVADQAFADVGLAVTYDRFRLSLDFTSPLLVGGGSSGVVGGYALSAPAVDAGKPPDLLSDARIGFDARLYGEACGPLRLGVGAQLYVPNGDRADYVTDGSYRAMLRGLVAGDLGPLTYAGHVGVHVRPLDDSPAPGSPRGSELLFGVAGGARLPLRERALALVVGPEIYGATALGSLFGANSTAVEGLVSGRVEGTGEDGPQLRVKLGVGGGLDPRFGAPEWRAVFGVEVFVRTNDADKDGIPDATDACPTVPGVRTKDRKTNGCPPSEEAPRPEPQ